LVAGAGLVEEAGSFLGALVERFKKEAFYATPSFGQHAPPP
jgi:hypothetical protein